MRITLIGCPFQTSYGEASQSLLKALENKTGSPVEWVATNCGCGDKAERTRQFQMPREKYKYFDMFAFSDVPSPQRWKNPIKFVARKIVHRRRAQKYRQLSTGAQVVNFQQTLSSYGSNALFYWLSKPTEAARVVTVHELDRLQLADPQLNRAYNNADLIIVQQGPLRDKLISLGVDPGRIEVVLHGTELPVLDENQPRDGIITYCGHHPFSGKGLHEIFEALALLKTRLRATIPKLTVHGFYSEEDQAPLRASAAQWGLEDHVVWLNQVSVRKAFSAYQSSLLCVLPYIGSFAGLAAATAAATGVPVIATRNAGIPEHLGENAIWIKDANAQEIATQIEKLLASPELRRDLSKRARRQAEQYLSWDTIADNTLAVYQRAIDTKAMHWLKNAEKTTKAHEQDFRAL